MFLTHLAIFLTDTMLFLEYLYFKCFSVLKAVLRFYSIYNSWHNIYRTINVQQIIQQIQLINYFFGSYHQVSWSQPLKVYYKVCIVVNISPMASPSTILLGSHKHQLMYLLQFYCAQFEILKESSLKSYYSDITIF